MATLACPVSEEKADCDRSDERHTSVVSESPTKGQSYKQFSLILKIDFSHSGPQSRHVCGKAVIPGGDGENNRMDKNRVQGNGF